MLGKRVLSTGSSVKTHAALSVAGTGTMKRSTFIALTATGIIIGTASLLLTTGANAEQKYRNQGYSVSAGADRHLYRPRQFRGYGVNSTRFRGYGVPKRIRFNRGYAILTPDSPAVIPSERSLRFLEKASKGGPKIIRVSQQMKRLADERARRRAARKKTDDVFDYAVELPDASAERNADVVYPIE